ncbi:hypothetical protein EGW08_008730 [Elysia chlorotica]|uniref:G-protein coupled receptors family 1 profile domain-containing protein n=1 Tax=Elysia chlorotica TaxID=188477 RepID=A0A3S0ZNY1_ELYCH|nr:hypothetical protein EGW08_008730 [Elysia chlorotica]
MRVWLIKKMRPLIGFESLLCVAGTLANLWFLWSILSSSRLRRSMRNQLLCNLMIAHLVQTLIVSPVEIAEYIHIINPPWDFDVYCRLEAMENIVGHIHSALTDWIIVFLVGLYCANRLNLNLAAKVGPRLGTMCQVAIHTIPWIIVVTATSVTFSKFVGLGRCQYVPSYQKFLLETFYTIIPSILSVLMLLALCVMVRRQSDIAHTDMRRQADLALSSDRMVAYVAIVGITWVCEIANITTTLQKQIDKVGTGYWMECMINLISGYRALLGLLPLLFLPDILDRVKTWRPWQPQIEPARIDLPATLNV